MNVLLAGCEFGDRSPVCGGLRLTNCSDSYVNSTCCLLCIDYRSPAPPTTTLSTTLTTSTLSTTTLTSSTTTTSSTTATPTTTTTTTTTTTAPTGDVTPAFRYLFTAPVSHALRKNRLYIYQQHSSTANDHWAHSMGP